MEKKSCTRTSIFTGQPFVLLIHHSPCSRIFHFFAICSVACFAWQAKNICSPCFKSSCSFQEPELWIEGTNNSNQFLLFFFEYFIEVESI
uniref:Uncharacterized protein n=1 Tax=Physcomitrium patens TaxID=3218 RepID=A0A2K1L816_PHYPA|nr:hypothetical protein PHYPA_000591 [Physcomitrium patens]